MIRIHNNLKKVIFSSVLGTIAFILLGLFASGFELSVKENWKTLLYGLLFIQFLLVPTFYVLSLVIMLIRRFDKKEKIPVALAVFVFFNLGFFILSINESYITDYQTYVHILFASIVFTACAYPMYK